VDVVPPLLDILDVLTALYHQTLPLRDGSVAGEVEFVVDVVPGPAGEGVDLVPGGASGVEPGSAVQ